MTAVHPPPPPSRLLRLAPGDNILVACGPIAPGPVPVDGETVEVLDAVALGHKVAAEPIAAGAAVIKHGARIGSARVDIPQGAHVHVHNVTSDYTPSHGLEQTQGGIAP